MNQEDTPLVTAVIPVYNHERYVVESVRSIVSQTYRNIELIVINDGSTDGSHEKVLTLVEECRRRFVRFEYMNRENKGLCATLNQALSMSRGVYFTALASDDIALPRKVELLVSALEARGAEYAAAFGNALFIDDKGGRVRLQSDGRISEDTSGDACDNFMEFHTMGRSLNCTGEDFGTYETLIQGNYLPAMSNVVRTAAISEAGGWTVGNLLEDWEMWLKLAKRYRFLYVDENVALYRWHDLNSFKADGGAPVLRSLLLLVEREKDYCREKNILSLWERKRRSVIYHSLRNKQLSFKEKLSLLRSTNKTSLLTSAMKMVVRKIANMS